MTENKIKSDAILSFVNMMIGAFDAGFVDENNPTLAEVYQVARNYVKDTYGVEFKNIIEMWGEDTAKAVGFISKPVILTKIKDG